MPKERQIKAVDELLHRLLWGLHLNRMDTWTPELERIGALGLHVLKLVSEDPNIILKEIKTVLDIPNSTLTSVVNRLEERGLLERVISRRDRRSYGLALTAEGRRVQADHDRFDRELARTMLEGLDNDEDRDRFVELISKIMGHMLPS